MCDGILCEVGSGVQAELFADASFVKFNRLGRDAEDGGDFLERSAFGHKLQNFALPERESRLCA